MADNTFRYWHWTADRTGMVLWETNPPRHRPLLVVHVTILRFSPQLFFSLSLSTFWSDFEVRLCDFMYTFFSIPPPPLKVVIRDFESDGACDSCILLPRVYQTNHVVTQRDVPGFRGWFCAIPRRMQTANMQFLVWVKNCLCSHYKLFTSAVMTSSFRYAGRWFNFGGGIFWAGVNSSRKRW